MKGVLIMLKRFVLLIMSISLYSTFVFSAQADDFIFSRNGLTWDSTWKQVQAAESHSTSNIYTKSEYPGFKNLEIYSPHVAGFEATSINYLFYNEHFLAIFYELSWHFQPIGMGKSEYIGQLEREAQFEKIISAMESKYGPMLPSDQDWLSLNFDRFPTSLLEYFDLKILSHRTWKVAPNTIASMIFYNDVRWSDEGHRYAALVYFNLDKLDQLGFEILPGTDTDGL